MGRYYIDLTDEQEKFVTLYLAVFKLRPEHTRADYPGLISLNFINGMMKRRHEFLGRYKDIYGKEFNNDNTMDQNVVG